DAGLLQVVAVEPEAADGRPRELLRQATEGVSVLVDDGHRVALGLQLGGQLRSDSAAADDDDVHGHHATRPSPHRQNSRSSVETFGAYREGRVYSIMKRFLVGRPIPTDEQEHQLL